MPTPSSVADAIVDVVDTPFGKRPFRVHIDPTQDGAEVAFAVIDRVRNEMLHRVGFSDLLHPRDERIESSALIESELKLQILVLTRFLHANRHPLRSKTL